MLWQFEFEFEDEFEDDFYICCASQRDNENKILVLIRITGYAFSRAAPRKSGFPSQE